MNNTPSSREVSIAFHQVMARYTDLSRVCLAFISPKEAMSHILDDFVLDNHTLLDYSDEERLVAIQKYVDTVGLHSDWVGYLSKVVSDYVYKRKAELLNLRKEREREKIGYKEYLEDYTPIHPQQED